MIALAAVLMFLVIYVPVIRAEEEYLRSTFPGFDAYAASVPRFFPRLHAYRAGVATGFSRELYMRHREYNAALGSMLMMSALILKMLLARQ